MGVVPALQRLTLSLLYVQLYHLTRSAHSHHTNVLQIAPGQQLDGNPNLALIYIESGNHELRWIIKLLPFVQSLSMNRPLMS